MDVVCVCENACYELVTWDMCLMSVLSDVRVTSLLRVTAGFLSTADENSPGNYGILDQAMAVNWVHNNIEYFNGDRQSVTLFGPGAGAASAGLLMVAPRTRNLVHKVIAQVSVCFYEAF